ncbi:MAG: hypothetical protein ACO3CJ_07630 [Burkholderiaceae bacterium]
MDEREPGSSTLPDTLGTVPSLLRGYGAQTGTEARGTYARKQLPALFQGGAEAEAQAKLGAFERDQEQIRKTAEAERDVARGTRMETEKLESGLQQRGVFEAPQYKASDYAANSATRLLTAVLLGGVARTSASGQLQAIKAMQDAEEKGLMADFEAARMRFDEQEKQRQDNNKMLKDRFDRMIDLLGKDRNAALVEAKLIEGNLGKGIIAAELRAGNYSKAYDLFNKAAEAEDKIKLERMKAGAKQAAGPDRRLKPGERWNEEKQVIEAIPGSDIYKKQQADFTKEYKSATSTIDQLEAGLAKIGEILDPNNENGFQLNFGGYNAYGTRMLSGDASDMRTKINSFKSEMKNAGLSLIRMGGSIGQITEREWPIVEQLIDAIDPVLTEDEARSRFQQIASRFQGIMNRAKDVYDTQFRDSQFYRPLAGAGGGTPAPSGGGGQQRQMSDEDRQALDWANSNPNDPRAAQIKRRLGVTDGF